MDDETFFLQKSQIFLCCVLCLEAFNFNWDTFSAYFSGSFLYPDEVSIIRDGIKPFSYYAIFVTTLIIRQGIEGSADIKSAASDIRYFQTPPGRPEAPEDLQVTPVNYSTVNITWTEPKAPNGIIATYKIEVKHHKVNIDRLKAIDYCIENENSIYKNEQPEIDDDPKNPIDKPDPDPNAEGEFFCRN